MKSAIFVLLVVVAMAMAAPQYLAPGCIGLGCLTGYNTGLINTYPRTLVAGPTVWNGIGGRIIAPGVVAPIY